MKRRSLLLTICAVALSSRKTLGGLAKRLIRVPLKEAHKGTLEVDTRLLDSYGGPPENQRQFYFAAREHFARNPDATFSDSAVLEAAAANQIHLMGGPLLGDLRSDGVRIWLRPATDEPLWIHVNDQPIQITGIVAGKDTRVELNDLAPETEYTYQIRSKDKVLASGQFRTAPKQDSLSDFRITFGSCFHKIGLHNPNLFEQILARKPNAMMLLGDLAVDDRNNEVNMHRADYQLRDVSAPWSHFVANMPVYSSWDDHDYFDNDLSGIPKKYNADDRDAVRQVWHENWNNPEPDDGRTNDARKGIYFNTRIGPAEIVMLDTRSCRDRNRRGKYGAYLGEEQLEWLKATLKASTAPFKIISSGTMWSDYVSNAKDTWGSWDTEAREELFSFIESEGITGVLLVSGDRHGARGFKIPRPSGFTFYEFEPATLGGVSGPAGLLKNCPEQMFGYSGTDEKGNDFIAFGEFTFEMKDVPQVTFRLIRETGEQLEEHKLTLEQLTPHS
ncbi:MAG: alkaline phosphatase D family protein [Aureliella sp.]